MCKWKFLVWGQTIIMMLTGVLAILLTASSAAGHPDCEHSYRSNYFDIAIWPKILGGPIRKEYPFRVQSAWYRLVVDNQGVEGGFFQEHLGDGRVVMLNDPMWSQILIADRYGEILEIIPILQSFAGGPGAINALFTTSTGTMLCRQTVNNSLWRYDSTLASWQDTGIDIPWLGTKSVAESRGAIMIAEYCSDTSPEGRVIRSRDDGRSWEVVLRKRAGISLPDSDPEIRHFHTIAVDPWSQTWYVSSGDVPSMCRVWVSQDAGTNWLEATDLDQDPESAPPYRTQSLHRLTTWLFSNVAAHRNILATDDRIGGLGAQLCISPATVPLSLSVVGRMSYNEIRSGTEYPGLGWLFLTENVRGYAGIEIVLVTNELEIIPVGVIEGIDSYFTSSVASTVAEGDLYGEGMAAFTLARGIQAPNRTLRYTVVREFGVDIEVIGAGCGHVEVHPPSNGGWKLGDRVRVEAIPAPGCTFHNYTGDRISRNPSLELVVTGDMHLVASFAAVGEDPPIRVPVSSTLTLGLAAGGIVLGGLRRVIRLPRK
jgi:hypothetical protein